MASHLILPRWVPATLRLPFALGASPPRPNLSPSHVTDRTISAALEDASSGTIAALGDVTGYGVQDLTAPSISNGRTQRESAIRDDGKGLSLVMADIDLDGDLDIYVANDATTNVLYQNDESGRFEEIVLVAG